ncbi:MAG TPA: cation diffusion facilitator family transporter [Candidatus Udaeobacter sp.]|jgi:cation diffusion facilitator family transporter|nr:cation diffusion facilitator family transporter [Candidatus Udaeobacter sp.]
MDACCEQKAEEITTLRGEHRKVLVVVLVINAVLFVVEAIAGVLAHSTALLADSLDMLGDSLVYGFSLYVLWRSAEWKAIAAVLKGIVMAAFGVGVLAEAIYKMTVGVVPVAETMGIIGLLVLLGNGLCFLLLFRHRSDDLNLRSTWLCSRNDMIANLSVLVAAIGVKAFDASWPDIVVGAAIAALFLRSAFSVLRESFFELRLLRSQSTTAA